MSRRQEATPCEAGSYEKPCERRNSVRAQRQREAASRNVDNRQAGAVPVSLGVRTPPSAVAAAVERRIGAVPVRGRLRDEEGGEVAREGDGVGRFRDSRGVG